jgi:hypothetical protein
MENVPDYRFSAVNKKIKMLQYTDAEYASLLQDPSWTRLETDVLFRCVGVACTRVRRTFDCVLLVARVHAVAFFFFFFFSRCLLCVDLVTLFRAPHIRSPLERK